MAVERANRNNGLGRALIALATVVVLGLAGYTAVIADSLGHRLDTLENWREKWILTVPALDARQNERLSSLERIVFSHESAKP